MVAEGPRAARQSTLYRHPTSVAALRTESPVQREIGPHQHLRGVPQRPPAKAPSRSPALRGRSRLKPAAKKWNIYQNARVFVPTGGPMDSVEFARGRVLSEPQRSCFVLMSIVLRRPIRIVGQCPSRAAQCAATIEHSQSNGAGPMPVAASPTGAVRAVRSYTDARVSPGGCPPPGDNRRGRVGHAAVPY